MNRSLSVENMKNCDNVHRDSRRNEKPLSFEKITIKFNRSKLCTITDESLLGTKEKYFWR